jgi:hypothetical protein
MLTLTSISKTFLGGFKPVLTNINLHPIIAEQIRLPKRGVKHENH